MISHRPRNDQLEGDLLGNLTDEELTKLKEMLAASKAKLIEHGQNCAAIVLKPNVTTSKRHGQGAD